MPVIQRWKEPGFPLQFEYSPDALEQIRQLAVEGLLMLPRTGIGVGGLLLGVREGDRARMLDSAAIPCEHASGPGFTLSREEAVNAVNMVRNASPLSVVGWYCSKTRGNLALSDADEQLYRMLCPEVWQVALLVRPSTSESSVYALCYRDNDGNTVTGAERILVCDSDNEPPEVAEEPTIAVMSGAPQASAGYKNKVLLAMAVLLVVAAALLLVFGR